MPQVRPDRRGQERASEEAAETLRASRLRLFGVAVLCAYVLLVPVVFDRGSDWPFVVPRGLLGHGLAFVLAGVIAGLLIQFGRRAIPWSWLHVPVLAFLGVNVLATAFAADRYLALYGSHARMLGLATLASWTVLYFAVVACVRERRDVLALGASALASAAVMLGYEAFQIAGLDPFDWNTNVALRPISTNGQPTTLGGYLTVLAMSALAIAVLARPLARWAQALLVLATLVLVAGAAATGTRSVLLGMAAGGVALVVVVLVRTAGGRARAIAAIRVLAAAAVLVALVVLAPAGGRIFQTAPQGAPPPSSTPGSAPGSAPAAEESGTQLDLASLEVRLVLYRAALDAVLERPLLGYGPDNFIVAFTRHRPETGPEEARLSYSTSTHGWIGTVLVGSGVLGFLAFLAMLGTAAVLTLRSRLNAVTCASAVAVAAFAGAWVTTVDDVASDWLVWLAAGLIAISAGRAPVLASTASEASGGVRRGQHRRTRGTNAVAGVVCVGAGALLAASLLNAVGASRSAGASLSARLASDVRAAITFGLDATASDPARAEYWRQLAFAHIAARDWRNAAPALERAIEHAPWDARNISDLIKVELVLANDGDAAARARMLQLVDDVQRVDPNYASAQAARAQALQFAGEVSKALPAIERALQLDPGSRNEQWYAIATQLYVSAGRAGDGVRVADRGLAVLGPRIPLRIERAKALLADGRRADAAAAVDAILTADPGNAVAQQLRDQIRRTQ